MRRFLLTCVVGFAAGFAASLAVPALADTRVFLADTTSCPSGTFTGQITTTLNPTNTTNTNGAILWNPSACGTNEIGFGAIIGSSTVASIDCEGDYVGVKGDFSGALHTSSTFTADTTSTMTGAVAFGASNTYQVGDIIAADILDVTRSVTLPIAAWVPCTGQGIWTTDATDTKPNLTAVNTALAITYDATGGSVDTGTICTSFSVPDGYVSGGAFVARVTQGGATVTNIETWSCNVSVNGASLVGANAANLTNQTAVQSATSTPVATYATGDSVGVVCSQGNSSADDTVNILSVRWTYTATE